MYIYVGLLYSQLIEIMFDQFNFFVKHKNKYKLFYLAAPAVANLSASSFPSECLSFLPV